MASGTIYGNGNSNAVSVKLDWTATKISGNTFSVDLELYGATDGYNSRTCWAYIKFGSISSNPSGIKITSGGYQLVYSRYGATITADDDCNISASIGFGYGPSVHGDQESWSNTTTVTLGIPTYSINYYSQGSNVKSYSDISKGATHTVPAISLSYSGDSTSTSNFIITGNANGGDGGNVSITATKTESVKHTFLGWSTSSSATSATYTEGSVFTVSSNITLYAVWRDDSGTTYSNNSIGDIPDATWSSSSTGSTVTLNANGGSVSPSSLYSGTVTSHTFKGWALSSSGTPCDDDIEFYVAITVYAIWETKTEDNTTITLPTPTRSNDVTTYTLTLYGNGGTVRPSTVYPIKVISYTFNGWATSSSASSGTTGTYKPTSDVTLYATWSSSTSYPGISLPTPTRSNSTTYYTVTLNANGGSVSSTTVKPYKTTKYTFNGWSTSTNTSGKISNASNYNPKANGKLYALWTSSVSTTSVTLPTPTRGASSGTYTITLDANGGSLPAGTENTITVNCSTSYTFGGWSTNGASSGLVSSPYYSASNITLIAIWNPTESTAGTALPTEVTRNASSAGSYNVTLDPVDGTVDPTYRIASISTKYAFKGWSTTTSTSDMVSSTNYVPVSDVTLYAVYSTTTSTSAVSLPNASKTDHTFLGWTTVEGDTNYVSSTYTPTSDIILYANYLANYRASLHIWYNGKWNKCIANLFTGDRFNGAI